MAEPKRIAVMAKRPFRFSWQAFNAPSAAEWRDKARKAEALGYSTFHIADHYLGPGPALVPTNHPPQELAAIPALAMAAEATKTINVGFRVLCTGYRPAPILVKEAMTIDFLSEGRLELGLGAGWMTAEFEAMGIPFLSPGKRISRLEETVELAKASIRGDMLDMTGEYVHAVGYQAVPAPVRGKIPIMIGGGAPRVLGLAGREADIVSINLNNAAGKFDENSFATSTAEETHEKIGWIRKGAGDRFDDIELEIGMMFIIINDVGIAEAESWAKVMGIPMAGLPSWPHALVGSVDSICDELQRRREEYGISYICIPDHLGEAFAPVVARLAGK
jgi:probable F420-dependent oxidoreductase